MSNINLGQFLNSLFKTNINSNVQSNISSAAAAHDATGSNNTTIFTPLPTPRVSVNFKAPETQLVNQQTQLNGADKSTYVKDLLNLPQTMEDFLLLMTSTASSSGAKTAATLSAKDLASLLLASNLDLSKMAALLQQNGKEALSKLIQMTAKFNQMGVSMKNDQMNELASVINASVSTAGASQNQALKSFLLLYLPWLPLGENTNFSIEIGSNSPEEGGESDDSVTILISTENFGNVKIILFKQGNKSITMQIACSKEFPKEFVEKAIEVQAQSYNVQTGIAFEEKQVEKPKKQETSQTQVSLNTSPGVNPFLILMAHAVIKIVIGVDKAYSLSEDRKKLIEDK